MGLPGLPLAVTRHPLASLSRADVKERAAAFAEEIARMLTAPAEQLAAEFAQRRYVQPKEVVRRDVEV